MQNFLAKPDTAMRSAPDAGRDEYLAAIAVARLVLGPGVRIQAPPNLSDPDELAGLLAAGIDDWGGVSPLTPDHVNPERPVAAAGRAGRADRRGRVPAAGAAHRAPVVRADRRAVAGPAGAAARPGAGRPGHRAGRGRRDPAGASVAGAGPGVGQRRPASTCTPRSTPQGRLTETRSDFDAAYGDWDVLREEVLARPSRTLPAALDADVKAALRAAERDPAGLSDAQALALMQADGPALEALCALADDLRRDVVGDDVTYVVNRNINFTNVCYTGCRFCAFAQRRTDADAFTLSLDEVGNRADEAWAAGATEVCLQGGIHPDLPGTAYFDIAAEIRRRQPDLHIHAFSPMEIVNGASRTGLSIRDWLIKAREAGLEFHSRAPPRRSSTTTSGGS